MKRFTNILFYADDVKGMEKALVRAVELARENDARLTVLDVVTAVSTNDVRVQSSIDSLQSVIVEQRKAELEKLVADVPGKADFDVGVEIVPGKAAYEVIRHVMANGNDLLIKAPYNRFGSLVFGTTDLKLLRQCPCPVWMVRHTTPKRYRKVMAAVDPNPESEVEDRLNKNIMELATSIAEMENAELHVVHAWDMSFDVTVARRVDTGEENADELAAHKRRRQEMKLDQLAREFPDAKFETHLLKGAPADVISRFAKEKGINLVVMGTVARTGVSGFLIGNTAEEILHSIKCSVLAIKPGNFSPDID